MGFLISKQGWLCGRLNEVWRGLTSSGLGETTAVAMYHDLSCALGDRCRYYCYIRVIVEVYGVSNIMGIYSLGVWAFGSLGTQLFILCTYVRRLI